MTVNRGYMYDPDDKKVLITEIYYEAATDTKLGSNMGSLSYSVASLSYIEIIEMSQ